MKQCLPRPLADARAIVVVHPSPGSALRGGCDFHDRPELGRSLSSTFYIRRWRTWSGRASCTSTAAGWRSPLRGKRHEQQVQVSFHGLELALRTLTPPVLPLQGCLVDPCCWRNSDWRHQGRTRGQEDERSLRKGPSRRISKPGLALMGPAIRDGSGDRAVVLLGFFPPFAPSFVHLPERLGQDLSAPDKGL